MREKDDFFLQQFDRVRLGRVVVKCAPMVSFFDDEPEVVPLITCRDGAYAVDAATAEWIETAPPGELVVVACAGKYRTGKSFLLNRLAGATPGSGFGVGETVQACTKGLWLYKRFFPTERADKHVLLVDTEGIDALDASDTHDVRIFTLALLLSSTFVYNSVGAIDETAMQTLALMTRVTENVRVRADGAAEGLAEHMPDFTWVLRDFALKLTDRDNRPIEADAYLELALAAVADTGKDRVRAALRDAFARRALVTLPRPATDESKQPLEDRLRNLSPRFTAGVAALRRRLFDDGRPLTADGRPVTGRMYTALCRHFASVVQTDAVPVIHDSWTLLASVQARDLRDELVARFDAAAAALPPQLADPLAHELAQLRAAAEADFDARAMPPVDPDLRADLVARLASRADLAYTRLVRELDLDSHLDELEARVLASPTDYVVLADDVERECVRLGGDAARWRARVDERCARAWFARVVDRLVGERDASAARARAVEESGMRELQEQAHRTQTAELEQRIASQQTDLASLRAENDALRGECATLRTTADSLRATVDSLQGQLATDANDDDNASPVADEAHDADQLRVELARLEDGLLAERVRAEQFERAARDADARFEQLDLVRQTLETSWRDGLERVRADADARAATHASTVAALTADLDEQRRATAAADERVLTLQRTARTAAEAHEAEVGQLRETIAKGRAQCETAQDRVLAIHQSMLDELRARDAQQREKENELSRERARLQAQHDELTRDNERLSVSVTATKRRVGELELVEREHKRARLHQQEQTLALARHETETAQLRQRLDALNGERETLRQENLRMEGELAVLRTAKELADARDRLQS